MKNSVKTLKRNSVLITLGSLVLSSPVMSLTVDSTSCNGQLNVSIASGERASTITNSDCQVRSLDDASGFSVAAGAAQNGVTADSAAMLSADGELYESFVASEREAAVLLTPNRALMISRHLTGDSDGIDWDLGLLVQPVTGGSSAWVTGTYTLMRSNSDVRMMDDLNQSSGDGLSQVFDPVTLSLTFNGDGTCTAAGYSSWFAYELTTDPAGAYSQPDGTDYALHQAVYAGEGSGQQHDESISSDPSCSYSMDTDGLVSVTYDFGGGNTTDNAYFMSADLRYMVSTVETGLDLYRGFEAGVRVDTARTGTQSELNTAVAGTYLFNGPSVEWQGSTGSNAENVTTNDDKSTECMTRGALVLTANAAVDTAYNTCTVEITSTCSVRGETGLSSAVDIAFGTKESSETVAEVDCSYQLSANSALAVEMTLDTAEGAQTVVFSGSLADNDEALVLRGKYEGADMANPSNTFAPERTISNDILLSSIVGIKYEGVLTADADVDGIDNLDEFLYGAYSAGGENISDANADGIDDIIWRRADTGQGIIWLMDDTASKVTSGSPGTNSSDFSLVGLGDFDGDDDVDQLFRNTSTGQNVVWLLDGTTKQATGMNKTNNSSFSVKAIADFNKDGIDDIFFRDDATGQNVIWTLDGSGGYASTSSLGFNAVRFSVEGTGDYDGDGDADIFFRDNATGENTIWVIENAAKQSNSWLGFNNTRFDVVTSADVDGDGDDDIYFRDNTGSGGAAENAIWKIESAAKVGLYWLGFNSTRFTVTAASDFDADGDSDIHYRDSSSGEQTIWIMDNGVKQVANWQGFNATRFTVEAVADFDGNDASDILYRDVALGESIIWLTTGGTKSSTSYQGVNNANFRAHTR